MYWRRCAWFASLILGGIDAELRDAPALGLCLSLHRKLVLIPVKEIGRASCRERVLWYV